MEITRRELLILPAAAAVWRPVKGRPALPPASRPIQGRATSTEQGGATPWSRKVRRVGQLNMTEHDPAALDVEAWADYWASLKVDAVLVSVTGILAFYQTKVPFHRKGKYLGTRDFFGDCCAAAKKRGIHVIARMSPDLNWEDAVQAHPEWFQRNAQRQFVKHTEDPRLFRTCMFTTYMTDYMTAIMKEVNASYDIDALYTNAWPPLGSFQDCHCDVCRTLPPAGTLGYWEKFNERTAYLWKLYDSIAKEKKPANFYFGNLGGGVRSTANLVELGNLSEWFQCDNQGRGGDDAPIWGCALQGRVCNAVQPGKMAANVTGAWSTGAPRWRNVHKSVAEAHMWFNETLASGMVPYHHIIGGETGLGEDRRALDPARKYFNWMAKHDRHFVNTRSIANIGVVMGQRTHLFHTPPPGSTTAQYLSGMYYALLEGRFLFDFVHEEKLAELSKYSALLLPNVALLSDRQCDQLRAYVDTGGSLLATFQTSLFNERGERRANFGLADVFGIRAGLKASTTGITAGLPASAEATAARRSLGEGGKAGTTDITAGLKASTTYTATDTAEIIGTNGNAYMGRIERQHEILRGFEGTHLIPGAEFRVPLAPVDNPVLTVVPGYVAYPPELSYPEEPRTSEPAMVVREKGRSRLVYFPGDVDRTMWKSGHVDLTRLLQNAIRWVAGSTLPVTIAGDGVIESFAWETEAGRAVHVLNYTNPAMHKGTIREFYAIGAQQVRMMLPSGARVTRVELLKAETDIPFRAAGGRVTFTIPRVVDYEVAAIHLA